MVTDQDAPSDRVLDSWTLPRPSAVKMSTVVPGGTSVSASSGKYVPRRSGLDGTASAHTLAGVSAWRRISILCPGVAQYVPDDELSRLPSSPHIGLASAP